MGNVASSIAEVPTTCGTLFITYPDWVGFASPEAAAEDAVAEFDSGVDLPPDLGEGETDLDGYDSVVVERTDAGYRHARDPRVRGRDGARVRRAWPGPTIPTTT